MYINLKFKITCLIVTIVLLVSILGSAAALAGSPDSPGAPDATSSYTLEDLYNRLNAGAAGSQSIFTEPSTAPGTGTMHTLNDIMAVAPVLDNTNGATQTHVLSGKTVWGLTGGHWGLITGTITDNGASSTIVPTTTNQSVAAGYWSTANTVQGDADLVAANIRSGVNLFGVDGTMVNASVPKTGQTTSYAAGDDGDLENGAAWPNPRFTDNSDGTVTDNLTGLIWLKDANCFALAAWATALTDANTLNSGECSLSDGSAQGDWRLPNLRELQSLVDYGRSSPALPNGHPFTNVNHFHYWSSSTFVNDTSTAWSTYMDDGDVQLFSKTLSFYHVWPVRGGQ